MEASSNVRVRFEINEVLVSVDLDLKRSRLEGKDRPLTAIVELVGAVRHERMM